MRPRVRMIAVDLDGTLLNSRKQVAAEDRLALAAAVRAGVSVAVVTGRSYDSARAMVEQLDFDLCLITSNGAIIRSRSGETCLRRLLPAEAAAGALLATGGFRAYTVLLYDHAGPGQIRLEKPATQETPEAFPSGANGSSPYLRGVAHSPWMKRNHAVVQYSDSLEQALDGDPVEVMFAGPVAVMEEVSGVLENGVAREAAASGRGFRLLRTAYPENDFTILDVVHPECSKGHALEHWSRLRAIEPAEVMAIGDNFNDLEMLRFAGVPVVMANASESLRRMGWPVTGDNESAGVAQAIHRYVLTSV